MPIRLLITARDTAAALHLVEVARSAMTDPRFEVVLVAQEPAAQHFAAAGLALQTVRWPSAKSAAAPSAAELRHRAQELLSEVSPDAVLSGLSTPFDAGIDEAVLAEAQVPTALYQDFWGEQNLILGRAADCILAVDQQAAARNLERFQRKSVIVGSARHSAYANLEILALRASERQALDVVGTDLVVGFFGQALHQLAGYERTVRQFVEAFANLDVRSRLIVRPHPRENSAQRAITRRWFADAGLAVHWSEQGTVERPLLACDLVVSLFSTCTFDTAYLNRFATEPIAVPVSLLFDSEIAAYCRQHGNYLEYSHHTLGLVRPVYDAGALPAMLKAALSGEARHEVWQRAHQHLPDPRQAPGRVLEAIASQVSLRRRGV